MDPGKAAGASVHAGKTYYFCSTFCRDQFERAPQKYLAAGGEDELFLYGIYFGLVFAPLYNFFHGRG